MYPIFIIDNRISLESEDIKIMKNNISKNGTCIRKCIMNEYHLSYEVL